MAEKILIIDDDLDTLRLVGLMLQKQGFQVVAANSGTQGLELAQTETPNLVLLDVMMPGLDGYEVARRLRADEKTVDIPILMFTAKSQLDDKVAGFDAGADDYLTKPTHPTELQAHVKALLARFSKNRVNPPSRPIEEPAYVIGLIAARGGLGVTTIAVNLAATLAFQTNSEVILAEFRPGQGTLCYDLGIEKSNGLSKLLGTASPEITRKMIQENLVKIYDKFQILPASARPIDAALLQNMQQFDTIFSRLQHMARYVVLDMGNGLTVLNQKLSLAVNELIVVVEPFENSLNHSQALLDDLSGLGVDKSNLFVAINYRLRSDTPQLSVTQIQTHLSTPIDATFTPAPELHQQAGRKRVVASQITQESLTAQQFNSLAQKIEARTPKSIKI